MNSVERMAPDGDAVLDYDRRHLALYAALLDAADTGVSWQNAASSLMGVDVTDSGAEACWRSHLERARWIVADGLGSALAVFSIRNTVAKAE